MKILAIKLSSLGDLFHALPAVHRIKVGLGAEIHWVVQTEYMEMVQCFRDVERVIGFPRNGFWGRAGGFLGELRRDTYDVVLDFQGLLKSGVVARLARGKTRIGPSFHREGAGCFYDAVSGRREKDRHAVEECMEMADHLGVPEMAPAFPVAFPAAGRREGRPRVAVAPAARWESKNWFLERFSAVGRRLREEHGATIFVLGGREDANTCEQLALGVGGGALNMAGKIGLPELGGLLEEMDLLIANDSGPIHVAAAVKTPVLAIFGCTDPKRTGPYGKGHRIVSASLDCRPCFSRRCRRGRAECLEQVTVEQVVKEASEMLAGHA